MEMYMAEKIHGRFRDTLIKSTGVSRVLNIAIDTTNVLIKVGLGLLLMWIMTNN